MLRSRAYFKRTRRGKVLRVVEEHYLRDDIGVGSLHGKTLAGVELVDLVVRKAIGAGGKKPLLSVLDTNVALNQLDFLENQSGVLGVVVILQTVLEEVRNNSLAAYRRLKKLLSDENKCLVFLANEHHTETYVEREGAESPNDRNDHAIRVATAWLGLQLGGSAKVLLFSYDRENLSKAKAEGVEAMNLNRFVEQTRPELVDLLAFPSEEEENMYAGGRSGGLAASDIPAEHLSLAELTRGIKAGRYFQGTIRVERDNWQECYVTIRGLSDEDRVAVLIRGSKNVNRAVDGDVVAIEILPKKQWLGALEEATMEVGEEEKEGAVKGDDEVEGTKYEEAIAEPTAAPTAQDLANVRFQGGLRPTGRIVGIVKRNWRVYCGSLQASADRLSGGQGTTAALFVPVEKRIPKVRIQTRQRESLSDKRILVAIDAWPVNSRYPVGHYVKTLGAAGDKDVETEVLLHEHNIPWEPFSDKVMACLPPTDWKITPDNSVGREDLRHIPIMSIDPPGCKDIDDALHCVQLPNGNFSVGVHIADVSYFVAHDSALEEEAANRCTSTYLVQKRLDMLPKLLTETLCSLTGNEEHFAFSVIWEMTPEAEIVDVKFCKSIIYSVGALSYGEAQMIMDDPNQNDDKAKGIRWLNMLAKRLRQKRMDVGALVLASVEVKFTLDTETQDPLEANMYQLKETNALVEEFMLLANITVGKKILRHFPTLSVLRRHPSPSRSQFEPLIAAAASRGFDLCVDDSKALQESLDKAVDPSDPMVNKIIRIMSTRCMAPAAYFCSGEMPQDEWHHYGLAAPIYTHFTSPIRRYADVVVHRLLSAAIGVTPLPERLTDKGYLHDLCETMNRRHRAAQMAGRGSTSFHTVLFFRENPRDEDAYVIRLFKDKMIVLVPTMGIEGKIDFKELADSGMIQHDVERHTLTYRGRPPVTIRIFDKVRVHISVEGKGTEKNPVVFSLLSPCFGKATDMESAKRLKMTT